MIKGVYVALQTTLLSHEEYQLNQDSNLHSFVSFVVPKAAFIYLFKITAVDIKYRVLAVKSLPILCHSAFV